MRSNLLLALALLAAVDARADLRPPPPVPPVVIVDTWELYPDAAPWWRRWLPFFRLPRLPHEP